MSYPAQTVQFQLLEGRFDHYQVGLAANMTDGGQTAAHSETETAKGTADHTAREYWRADIQCRVCNMGTYSPVRRTDLGEFRFVRHCCYGVRC